MRNLGVIFVYKTKFGLKLFTRDGRSPRGREQEARASPCEVPRTQRPRPGLLCEVSAAGD